ncbi:MAG: helix-turn-helix domain-containing protein [Candidatus Binataceae bacterium]
MANEPIPLPLDDVILSEAEAARLIGIAKETLNNWRRRGTSPPFFRVSGGVVRYSRRKILDWLQERTVDGAMIKKVEEVEP